ncbi:diuretic hormone receptor-like [Limulus polyphemus]|uniref:Diuretic hormone receptor-like n=1 Tax=Limulus polyphemus TaxID=6850 RepID=A0ABM1S9Q5_LIMPO|nr:diuretic hormone receptor-like [Limulus polyphemus]
MSIEEVNFTSWHKEHDFANLSWPALDCLLKFSTNSSPLEKGEPIQCNVTWDGVSCWPPTPAGFKAEISCFSELKGIRYDTSQNASRLCYENGTWANRSDYSNCKHLLTEDEFLKVLWDVKEATTVYYVGYGVSLIALLAALSIFLYFKDLRCLRNTIHTNLFITYILLDLTWIVTAKLQLQINPTVAGTKAACVLTIFLTYLMGTNFFWMFVEGLYLYVLVVKTFSIDIFKIHSYLLVGWGLPAIVLLIWAPVKAFFSPSSTDKFLLCPWQSRDNYDYIFISPVILVLVVNMFFLGQIMWVLITKLRAATTIEHKQYRKAAKALLVLIPLLGVTYVLVIVTPTHRTARVIFTYVQATLLSTQGLSVSILYCFLNGEVQNTLRQHLQRWKTSRSVGGSTRYSITYRFSSSRKSSRLTSCGKGEKLDLKEAKIVTPEDQRICTTGAGKHYRNGSCNREAAQNEVV